MNVLYEKTDHPPKAGSIKEAAFLTVWLRRQEAVIHRERLLVQGLADLISLGGGKIDNVQSSFKTFINSIFPFQVEQQADKDKEMKQVMEREVQKGAITFTPMDTNFLKKKAKSMEIEDDFKKKLQEKARKGRT